MIERNNLSQYGFQQSISVVKTSYFGGDSVGYRNIGNRNIGYRNTYRRAKFSKETENEKWTFSVNEASDGILEPFQSEIRGELLFKKKRLKRNFKINTNVGFSFRRKKTLKDFYHIKPTDRREVTMSNSVSEKLLFFKEEVLSFEGVDDRLKFGFFLTIVNEKSLENSVLLVEELAKEFLK